MQLHTKRDSCRYHSINLNEKFTPCHMCNQGETLAGPYETLTDQTICETCPRYKNMYIEFPIQVDSIKTDPIEPQPLYKKYIGMPCAVRLCRENDDQTTYMGIFLGELPYEIHTRYHEDIKMIHQSPNYNPAIFVPELKEIVFGYESWWKICETPDDFHEITAADIQSQWYIQLFRQMTSAKE